MENTENKNLNKEEEAYLERELEEMEEHINPDRIKNNQEPNGSDNDNSENIMEDLESVEAKEQPQITVLEQKVAELKDLYVRSQAEVQNVQRRCIEDVKKARDYSISSFAKDIITVKDYLEMALKDQSGDFDTLKTGVDLTLKQLVQVFERHLIKEISPAENDKLDPHLHQAMTSVEKEGVVSNSVIAVMQKGYILNERVLRPAMVTVAK
jgi:molecular chaperone GrpE